MSETGVTGELAALRERVAELEAAEAQRRRAEQVQEALYRIAETASAARDMHEFYAAMHQIVGELMDARNFFIALYDEARHAMNWPYYVDEVDPDVPDPDAWDPIGTGEGRGLTAYVLRTSEPLLATPAVYRTLLERGEVETVGQEGVDWLGVPLTSEGRTLGALVVQSYTEDVRYTEEDKELLTFVGRHVASALQRTRLLDETRQRAAELSHDLSRPVVRSACGRPFSSAHPQTRAAAKTPSELRIDVRLIRGAQRPYDFERASLSRADAIARPIPAPSVTRATMTSVSTRWKARSSLLMIQS